MLPLAVLALALADPPTVFADVTVIDVVAGKHVPHRSVVVTGKTITAVEDAKTYTPPAGARVIDGRGQYLMPGLWDAHAHIADMTYLPLFLGNGVTSVRELHAFFPEQIVRTRDQIAAGKLAGPRLVVAGSLIDGDPPIWPASLKATTADEGRAAVRKLKGWNVDLVKVYESLPPDAYRAIVAEAKAVGLPVDGHVPKRVSAADATALGQRTIEHLSGIDLACSADEPALRKQLADAMATWKDYDYAFAARVGTKARESADAAKRTALFAAFAKNGTRHTPTLTVLRRNDVRNDPAVVNDDRLKHVTPYIVAGWRAKVKKDMPKAAIAALDAEFAADRRTVKELHDAGVPLLAGTDCTNPFVLPGFSLHDELALLVGCGLTPAEVLRTATINPAAAFGLSESLGSVAAGKAADLILLSADPLADVANTTKLAGVVAAGRYYPDAERKALLDDVAKKYRK